MQKSRRIDHQQNYPSLILPNGHVCTVGEDEPHRPQQAGHPPGQQQVAHGEEHQLLVEVCDLHIGHNGPNHIICMFLHS